MSYFNYFERLLSSSPESSFLEIEDKESYFKAENTKDVLSYAFYKVASQFTYCLSQEQTLYFERWHNYYGNRLGSRIVAYKNYGNKVIDFTLNVSPLEYVEKRFQKEERIEKFINTFGKETVDFWLETDPNSIVEVDQRKLIPRVYGNCYGMCLDFILHYLKNTQNGESPLDAVCLIASRYREGTPKEALLAQVFAQSYVFKEGRQEELLKMGHNFDSLGQVFTEAAERAVVSKIGLKEKGQTVLLSCSYHNDLVMFFNSSLKGCYKIGLVSCQDMGHSIVIVKADDIYLLFDPTDVILHGSCEEISSILLKKHHTYYPNERRSYLRVTSLDLAESL